VGRAYRPPTARPPSTRRTNHVTVVCPACRSTLSVTRDPRGHTIECGGSGEGSCCGAQADGSEVCEAHGVAHGERADVAAAFGRAAAQAQAVWTATDAILDEPTTPALAEALFRALLRVGVAADPDDDEIGAATTDLGDLVFERDEAQQIQQALALCWQNLSDTGVLRAALAAYRLRDHYEEV